MRQVIGSQDLGSMHPEEDLSPRDEDTAASRRAKKNSHLIRSHVRLQLAAATQSPTKEASPGFGADDASPDPRTASAMIAAAVMGRGAAAQPTRFRVAGGGVATGHASRVNGAAGAMIRTRARRRRSSIRSALDAATLHKKVADMASRR